MDSPTNERSKADDFSLYRSAITGESRFTEGLKATTHWASIEKFKNEFQNVEVIENVKFVDEGHIITSAGISAGINMAFHIVKNLLGMHVAEDTAKRMEYDISLLN